jgi:hypothetical protein
MNIKGRKYFANKVVHGRKLTMRNCWVDRGRWRVGCEGNMKFRDSRNGGPLSEEAQCRRPLERAPLLGTLKDMLDR